MARLVEITGKALSGEWGTDDLNNTGIPVLRTTNFTNEGYINYNEVITRCIKKNNIKEKMLKKGDIIIEKSGGSDKQPVGRVVFFEGEEDKFLFNNFTGLLRVKDTGKWFSKYVFYALFANYIKGGTLKFENRTTGLHNLQTDNYIEATEIVEYSFKEQKQIVEILDKVSGLIEKRKQQLLKLDELVKSRFIEMFGDIVVNNKQWQIMPFDKICNGIGDGLHGTPEYTENGEFPFINGNNLLDGSIVITNSTKMVNQKVYEDNYISIGTNAILISINGTLGKLAFYNGEKVMLGKSACYCNLKLEINRVFVYWLMKSDSFIKYLEDNSTKSTIKNVGLKAMRNYPIIIPPIELQNQFAEFVEQVEKQKANIKQSLEKLEILKKSLMQKYFG